MVRCCTLPGARRKRLLGFILEEMAKEYSLVPKRVSRVETPYRRIVTEFPVPESLPTLEKLFEFEPLAMRGQPPVVWNRADGFQVHDAWGNQVDRLVFGSAHHQRGPWPARKW